MGRTRNRGSRGSKDITPDDGSDADMGDVTAATLPPDVPQNPDGSVSTEGDVDEFQAKKIGAVSIESAAKNKANARKMTDKALGRKVRWNSTDALEQFDVIKTTFAPEWGAIIVTVTREEPGPIMQYPPVQGAALKDSIALYNYVENCHGSSGPATYKVTFRMGSMERGSAPLRMPDRSAPPIVQVVNQQPQHAQGPQYAPPPYPPPPGYGGGGWPGGSAPPQGYWPQQQPQQQPQREIVVISPPGPQAQPQQPQQMAPAPAPLPPPQYVPPPPAPLNTDLQRLVEQMGQQQAAMMSVLKDIVETSRRPAGFVALPEGYPIAPGYVAVPGGMIPNPLGVVGVGQVPQQVQHVPVVQQAPAPAPAQVVIREPAPTASLTPDQQISGAVKMVSSFMRGMEEMQDMVNKFGAAGRAQQGVVEEPEEPEAGPPPAPNPVMTTQITPDFAMAFNVKDGSTNWVATVLGALPKVMNIAKDGIHEYQKVVERQAALTKQAVDQKILLANAVTSAQRAMNQPPAALPSPPQAPPPQQAAPATVQARPPQTAPPQVPVQPPQPPQPVRRPAPKMPIPSGPLWG